MLLGTLAWSRVDERHKGSAARNTLRGYHVPAVFAGHSYGAFHYNWQSLRVFQINSAKAENGTGNNDGNGSFTIVGVTNPILQVVTCRFADTTGHYELIAPFFAGPVDPGPLP